MKYWNSLNRYLSRDWPHLYLILKLYLVSLVTFSIFRFILFLTQIRHITKFSGTTDILQAFLIGLRFDLVISGYLLFLPGVLIILATLFNRKFRLLDGILFYLVFIMFSLAFTCTAADIPYFNQFYSRLSVTAFEWMNSPAFVFKMIFEEARYWLVIIPLILLIVGLFKLLRIIWKQFTDAGVRRGNILFNALVSLLFLGFMFLGIRGRLEMKSPIRVGTAYFSNNACLNQLGLNPNFTLIRSYLDSRKEQNQPIRLIDDRIAIDEVRKFMHIKPLKDDFPIAREVSFDPKKPLRYNVVLVIMESMSADKMGRHGNNKNLTPFLDKLSTEGLYFDNIYSAGMHTFNGIYGSLFSYPALFRQHPMKESTMLCFNGLPYSLKNAGYSTVYFTTHDGQFDNVEGFLKNNQVEKVISKSNYPQAEVKTTLGVPDDYMFSWSIKELNALSQKGKPFLAAYMTASDHVPFYIPEYFKPRSSDIKDQIVEYADWSLERFVTLCSREPWFRNTIFVFVADHGAIIDGTYEMPVSYYHSPLIFYCPELFREGETNSCVGGQIDLFPTLMGILQQPYINNSPGIDLRRESRPYIYVNGDDKYGVFDKDWFLIIHKDNSTGLYKYALHDTHNYASEYPEIVKQMKHYADCNLQVAEYNLVHGKQFYAN